MRLPWWASAILASCALVVVALPYTLKTGTVENPRQPWYPTPEGEVRTGLIVDQVQYLRITDSVAGRASHTEMEPFTNRSLAPWLAGQLPLRSGIALPLVTISILVLGTFALALLAQDLTRSRTAVLVTVLVWAISWPVLRYAGAAYVDPASVGLIPCALLALWRRRLLVAGALIVAAVWMKESALVVVVVAVALEWTRPEASRRTRWTMSVVWVVTAVAAVATAGTPGGDAEVVFAPWVPDSLAVMQRMAWFNLSPKRALAFSLTVLPTVFGLAMWWRGRRTDRRVLPDADAVPLVLGAVSGMALGLTALPTALWDGRTPWTALPMGALLVGGWAATRERGPAVSQLWRFARVAVPAVVGIQLVFSLTSSVVGRPVGAPVLPDDYEPRFMEVPDHAEPFDDRTVSGRGSGTVELAGGEPLLVDFEGTGPVMIEAEGRPLLTSMPRDRGTALWDSDADGVLVVSAPGRWTVRTRPVSSAVMMDRVSAYTGEGPNVMVFPGGLRVPLRVEWSSEHAADQIHLVGQCRYPACGELGRDDVVPVGTEALVVDTAGEWSLAQLRGADRAGAGPAVGESAS